MSLDVSLSVGEEKFETCYHCGGLGRVSLGRESVFDYNITHNLTRMADEAGIYKALWRPEEVGVTKAGQLIEPLREGLRRLVERPDHFRKFDAPNGWGRYEHLVEFVRAYLAACEANPDADVRACR